MRAAPRGREASGYVLLTGAPAFIAGLGGNVFVARFIVAAPASLALISILASVAALAGVLAVSLLPPGLTESKRPEPR